MNTEVDGCFNMFPRRKSTEVDQGKKHPPSEPLPIAPSISAEEYPMNHSRRGTAIVFNHVNFSSRSEPRVGSDSDVAAIRLQFAALGFNVQVHDDPRRADIIRILEKVAGEKDADVDCLVVMVLTHGDLNQLQAYDTSYRPNKLWEIFTADRCPALAGKPKLFFIQACRGSHVDRGVRVTYGTQVDSSPKVSYTIPTWADMLIANASFEGHYAYRNQNGSVFIQALCRQLAICGETKELCQILTGVNRQVATAFAAMMPDSPRMQTANKCRISCQRSLENCIFGPKPGKISSSAPHQY